MHKLKKMIIVKNVQGVIVFAILFLITNQVYAAEWIHYASTFTRDIYYDKSSIKKVNKNILSVWTKQILNEDGKTKHYSFLKSIRKAPDHPQLISYVLRFSEIDCVTDKIKDYSAVIYGEGSHVIYSSPKGEAGKWYKITKNSAGEKLKKIVCDESATPHDTLVTPSIVTDKYPAQLNSKPNEKKNLPEAAVQVLVTKWLNSWKSGDMNTYRSCYSPDFQSKGMNLDAWVSHKANVHRKSKNINISIDQLKISAKENQATAVFTQSYRSSLVNDSGKKKLELRKFNGEWKIYREMM